MCFYVSFGIWHLSPWMTELFYTATGSVSSYAAEHGNLLKNRKKWQKWTPLGESLFIRITRSSKKSVYKWDWKSYWKDLAQRRISWFFEDGTDSAVAERSICFWWYSVLRSPCKSDLLYFLFIFFNRQFIFPGHCSSGCDSQCCPDVKFFWQKWSNSWPCVCSS